MRTRISMVHVGTDRSFIGTFALMRSVREKRIAVSIRSLNHGGILVHGIVNVIHLVLSRTRLESGTGFE